MLMQGSYPLALKRRVAADYGHLSNEQAAQLLQRVAHPELHVMIGHISEQNNDPSNVCGPSTGSATPLPALELLIKLTVLIGLASAQSLDKFPSTR